MLICCVCPARSQTKKLHELFKAMEREKEELKRQNEQLKRHCGMGPSGTVGAGGRQVVASRQHGASGASARTALTPPFHSAAGTQMVSKASCACMLTATALRLLGYQHHRQMRAAQSLCSGQHRLKSKWLCLCHCSTGSQTVWPHCGSSNSSAPCMLVGCR